MIKKSSKRFKKVKKRLQKVKKKFKMVQIFKNYRDGGRYFKGYVYV